MSKRSALDFLSLLSGVNTNVKPQSKRRFIPDSIPEGKPQEAIIEINVNLPEFEMKGETIDQNEWYNGEKHDFISQKPEFQSYKFGDMIALSTSSCVPEKVRKLNSLMSESEYAKDTTLDPISPLIFDYKDVFCAINDDNVSRMRKISSLHVLNHIMNDLHIKNSRPAGSQIRDSGFTATNCLIICPTRHQAYKFVKEMFNFLPSEFTVEQEERFEAEYFVEVPKGVARNRPADWLEIFGGNNDQQFKTGIRFFSNKVSLCQSMAKSQLVIASPLAIMLHDDKSFLSSIEVLVLDSIETLIIQHPTRLSEVISAINLNPLTVQETDWSRLRTYYSDKQHQKMRQNIAYSTILTPDINSLFLGLPNIRGSLMLKPAIYQQILDSDVERQYKRLVVPQINQIGDVYFKAFKEKLLPQIKVWRSQKGDNNRTLIVFSSSYQFYRARKLLEDSGIIFYELADEATEKDSKEMRKSFKIDPNGIMIITERYYYHFRPKFVTANKVVFFQPPTFPQLTVSLASNTQSITYFTEYDKMALERIVGTEMCERLIIDGVYQV